MAIDKLLELMTDTNIAETIMDGEEGEEKLMGIGQAVLRGFGADWDTMADWRNDIVAGLELIKPASKGRSEPWEGAANFKSPILSEARLKFGDRASQEMLNGNDLVKASVIGKDPDGEKAERIERVQTVMDWQLIVENLEWVTQQDKLFYDVSCHGHMFKKVFFDAGEGHNRSEVIKYPNFAINQQSATLESAPRFTHRLFLTPNEVKSKQLSGVWLDTDIELGAKGEQSKREDSAEDKVTEFYEQQTWLDLDGDGYEEPYVVTVHAGGGNVMRIRAQYGLDNITVIDDNDITTTMDRLVEKEEDGSPVIIDEEIVFKSDNETVIKISRDSNIIEYPFLVNPQDEYLSVGYFHLLGAYCQGINSTSNQLIDAGTLSNTQGGWLARGFRKKAGNLKTGPGKFIQTDISAQDLATGIRMFDIKEPSQTLFALNQAMNTEAQRLSSTTDLSAALGQNTPATTALSIIQEAQEASGALILRLYRSMSREFAVWFKLNAKFMDFDLYAELVDSEDASPMDDFNTQDMNIMPASNPKNSSKIQRIQTGQAQLNVMDQVTATGGNAQPIVKSYLGAIGSENLEEVYPELSEEEAEAQAQESARVKELEEQLRFLPVKAQADLGQAEMLKAQAQLLDKKIEAARAVKDGLKIDAEIDNINADTIKKVEEAETESTKNIGAQVDAAGKLKELDDSTVSSASQTTEVVPNVPTPEPTGSLGSTDGGVAPSS